MTDDDDEFGAFLFFSIFCFLLFPCCFRSRDDWRKMAELQCSASFPFPPLSLFPTPSPSPLLFTKSWFLQPASSPHFHTGWQLLSDNAFTKLNPLLLIIHSCKKRGLTLGEFVVREFYRRISSLLFELYMGTKESIGTYINTPLHVDKCLIRTQIIMMLALLKRLSRLAQSNIIWTDLNLSKPVPRPVGIKSLLIKSTIFFSVLLKPQSPAFHTLHNW